MRGSASASASGGKRKVDGHFWDVGVTDPEHFLARFGDSFKTSAGSRATSPSEKAYVYIREGLSEGRGFFSDEMCEGDPERSHPSNKRSLVPSFATLSAGGLYVPPPPGHKGHWGWEEKLSGCFFSLHLLHTPEDRAAQDRAPTS